MFEQPHPPEDAWSTGGLRIPAPGGRVFRAIGIRRAFLPMPSGIFCVRREPGSPWPLFPSGTVGPARGGYQPCRRFFPD